MAVAAAICISYTLFIEHGHKEYKEGNLQRINRDLCKCEKWRTKEN
jgi:hypothetical protein